MSWWTKHRTAVIGGTIGLATGGVGAALIGAAAGAQIDSKGGITNALFGEQATINPTAAALPSRNDVVMNVLNEQLAAVKKRQQSQQLGTNMMGDQTSALASTTLFGA